MKKIGITIILLCNLILQGQKPTQPNFLFIIADDLKTELGCYGSTRVKTPNIDALAKESVVFKNAYCNASVCGPSRASLFTGLRTIPKKRFKNWNCRADVEAKEVVSFPEYLKKNGYHTISNGKIFHHQDDCAASWSEPSWRPDTNHEAGYHNYNDYNDWHNPASALLAKDKKGPFFEAFDAPDSLYHDGMICDKTIADIRRMAKNKQPFFIGCGFYRPHLPFNAPQKYWDLYQPENLPTATNRFFPANAPQTLKSSKELLGQYTANEGFPDEEAFHKKAIHGYLACVSFIDAQVGKLVNELKAQGLWENTVVVFLGDNGFILGEHNFWGKHNTMNLSINVPLIIKAPKTNPSIQNQNIEFTDLYPTITKMAKLDIPSHCVGKNAASLLSNPSKKHKKYVFTGHDDAITVKYKNFIYTEWLSEKESMLYDLKIDPNEDKNIAEDPKNKKLVQELHEQLEKLKSKWPNQ
jgi:iduronate 2-sulfatase